MSNNQLHSDTNAAQSIYLRSLISGLNTLNENPEINDDLDQSIFEKANCKYYDIQEFNTLVSPINSCMFSAFHLNISSLSRHFDEFNTLLSLLNFNFGIIVVLFSHLPLS